MCECCPAQNWGMHYPKRFWAFLGLALISFGIAIILVVTITIPKLDEHNDFEETECIYQQDEDETVYVHIINLEDISECLTEYPLVNTSNPLYAIGKINVLLEQDDDYEQGDSDDCWYEKTTLSCSESDSIDDEWPPQRNCAPNGFDVFCNSTACSVDTPLGGGGMVMCEDRDQSECIQELKLLFPDNATFVCFQADDDVLARLDFGGLWLIFDGFLGVFGFFGIVGCILSTLINQNPRNDANCFGFF
mmetsp:Transcript_15454/g.23162  ORF Transcript_15454/g.23162 Transcript_15454/m.23162 type:complete len:248 (-) Transcript_15454:10-753(-)